MEDLSLHQSALERMEFIKRQESFALPSLCSIAPALPANRKEMEPGRQDGGDRRSDDFQFNNIKLKNQGGTAAIYTLKRLKRDRPDLFEQVIGGIMSANV